MEYLHPSEIERLSHTSNHPFDAIRADALTPSDYIFLGAARWDAKPDTPGLRSMGKKPTADALHRAIATAFLVNERAGNIELSLSTSRYLHYNRFQHIEARLLGRRYHWPADSLEGMLEASGKVLDIVHSLADEGNAGAGPLTDRLLACMATRGLVRRLTERRRIMGLKQRARQLFLIRTEVYQHLDSTAAITASRFIPSSAATRPELTEELLRDIQAAFA